MALFGAPLAHEDHAQRACHAALKIQSALKRYGQDLETRFGVEFKMRIGLNSGHVIVGSIDSDHWLAEGHDFSVIDYKYLETFPD